MNTKYKKKIKNNELIENQRSKSGIEIEVMRIVGVALCCCCVVTFWNCVITIQIRNEKSKDEFFAFPCASTRFERGRCYSFVCLEFESVNMQTIPPTQ